MRADKNGQVGFYDNDLSELKYSPFHVCNPDGGQRSMPFARTIFHFGGVFEAATACLNKVCECDGVSVCLCECVLVCRMWSGRLCLSCFAS